MSPSYKGLWILAYSLAVLIGIGTGVILYNINAEAEENVAGSLVTVRDTTHHSVKAWFRQNKAAATVWANTPLIRRAAEQLVHAKPEKTFLQKLPIQRTLRNWFTPLQVVTGYQGYFIIGPDHINLASSRDQNLGVMTLLKGQTLFLRKLWAGNSAVSLPTTSDVPLPGPDGKLLPGLPTMFVGAPIIDDDGAVIAVFLFRISPSEGLSNILKQGRIGKTGETYAFDGQGRLISLSRFDDQLRAIGMISPTEQAMLNLYLRDPGVNLKEGQFSETPTHRQPLTRMAKSATSGEDGVDLIGYRDYRGVPVVGAWLWDSEVGYGIATELDVAEAFRTLHTTTIIIVSLTVLVVLLLLGLVSVYTFYQQRKQTAVALRAREAVFRALVEAVGSDYLLYRQKWDGTLEYVTPAIERFTGIPPREAIGKKIYDLVDMTKETFAHLERQSAKLKQGEATQPYEINYRHLDGTNRTVEVTERPEFDTEDKPIAILGILKDVTERNKTEEELRRAATVFNNTDEGIIVTDPERNVIVVNRAFTQITGYDLDEVIGKNLASQQSGRHDAAFYEEIWGVIDHQGEWRGEIWNRRKNGEVYPAWENITAVKDDCGHVSNYVAVFSDITKIKASEERMTYLAHHDPLTKLPNRLHFMANLEQAIEGAKRHKNKVALMFLDLDRFKSINDTIGHVVGDELLKLVAERLKNRVRAEDTVARLGGDEFTIILPEISRPDHVSLIAEKIVRDIGQPFYLRSETISISVSVGISIYPDDSNTSDGLLKAADAAMYHAKSRGRNQFCFHTKDLTAKAMARLTMEDELRHTIKKTGFVLHYQPQVHIEDHHVVGVEALIRWQHPQKGLLMPASFIEIADESGLIDPITEWVLRTVCKDLKKWKAQGLPPLRIAVNISGRQVMKAGSLRRIVGILEDLTDQSHSLGIDIEITEDSITGAENVIDVMTQLKRRGVMLAIDDFGTGHSSLSRLKELPVDTLKIDRSFISDIARDPNDKAIASAIIAMARSLDLRVIGEGVEDERQLAVLRELGCDDIQGFYCGRPMEADKIANMLAPKLAPI